MSFLIPKFKTNAATGRYYATIAGWLILGALLCIAVLALVVSMVQIDPERPVIEERASALLHRKVSMGHLSYRLDFHGLVLKTESLDVRDSKGIRVLLSGPTEFALEVLPLLGGQVVIKAVYFQNPELWLIRKAAKVWNVSDIIAQGKTVSALELEHGKIHFRDLAGLPRPLKRAIEKTERFTHRKPQIAADDTEMLWLPHEVEEVRLSLVRPSADRSWPFELSFAIPHTDYTTNVKVSGLGHGLLDEWQKKQYKFDLSVTQLNPLDLRSFAKLWPTPPLPKIEGLVDARIVGQAIYEKQIDATCSLKTSKFQLLAPEQGEVELSNTLTTVKFLVNPQRVEWHDLNLKAEHFEMASSGSCLMPSHGAPAQYSTQVKIKTDNLDLLSRAIRSKIAIPRLTGDAELEATISGSGAHPDITAKITSQNITAKPGQGMVWARNVSAAITLTGTHLVLNPVSATIGDGQYQVKGEIELLKQPQLNLNVHGTNADLISISRTLSALKLSPLYPGHKAPVIEGHLSNMTAKIKGSSKHPELDVVADLDKVRYQPSGSRKSVVAASGNGSYRKHRLQWTDLIFNVPSGQVRTTGSGDTDNSSFKLRQLHVTTGGIALADANFILSLPVVPDDCRRNYKTFLSTNQLRDLSGKIYGEITLLPRQGSPSLCGLFGFRALKGQLGPKRQHFGPISLAAVTSGRNLRIKSFSGSMLGGKLNLSGQVRNYPNIGSKSVKARLTPNYNFKFRGQHIDLANAYAMMDALHVDLRPVVLVRPLGLVRDLSIEVAGSVDHPKISLTSIPQDVYYQLPGSTDVVHVLSGIISYRGDAVELKDVSLTSALNKLTASMYLSGANGKFQLRRLKIDAPAFDIEDVHTYLSSELTPPELNKQYKDLLAQYQLSHLNGTISGHLSLVESGHYFQPDGSLHIDHVRAQLGPRHLPLELTSGTLSANGSQLKMSRVNGTLGQTKFRAGGWIDNFQTDKPSWTAYFRSRLSLSDILQCMPDEGRRLGSVIGALKPISVRIKAKGNSDLTTVTLISRQDISNEMAMLAGPAISPRKLDIATLIGSMLIKPGSVDIAESSLTIERYKLAVEGKYTWPTGTQGGEPSVRCRFHLAEPIPAASLAGLMQPEDQAKNITGTVQGGFSIKGPLSRLVTGGGAKVDKLCIPHLNLNQISGKIKTPKWYLTGSPPPDANANAQLLLSSASYGKLKATDVQVDFLIEGTGPNSRIIIPNGHATVAGGTVSLNGWYSASQPGFHIQSDLSKMDMSEVMNEMVGSPKEVTGQLDAKLDLDSYGKSSEEMIKHLSGDGQLTITNGIVQRCGKLEDKLAEAYLFRQGFAFFSLNNWLRTVGDPSGAFTDIKGTFKIDDGNVRINRMHFHGPDMRLWGSGNLDLPVNSMKLDLFGYIPRVSSKSSSASNKAARRNGTPGERPRTFGFEVVAPINQPDEAAKSISKSFHWLPNAPTATAHPVSVR